MCCDIQRTARTLQTRKVASPSPQHISRMWRVAVIKNGKFYTFTLYIILEKRASIVKDEVRIQNRAIQE
jgi:hypothetical protein